MFERDVIVRSSQGKRATRLFSTTVNPKAAELNLDGSSLVYYNGTRERIVRAKVNCVSAVRRIVVGLNDR